MKTYYTIPEVAQIFGRTPNTVRLWVNERRLAAVKFRGRFIIHRSVIDNILKTGLRPADPKTCFPGACDTAQDKTEEQEKMLAELANLRKDVQGHADPKVMAAIDLMVRLAGGTAGDLAARAPSFGELGDAGADPDDDLDDNEDGADPDDDLADDELAGDDGDDGDELAEEPDMLDPVFPED